MGSSELTLTVILTIAGTCLMGFVRKPFLVESDGDLTELIPGPFHRVEYYDLHQ